MDFFDHQDRARRHTWLLLFSFALAVVIIVATVYFLAVGVIAFLDGKEDVMSNLLGWHPEVLLIVIPIVTAVIAAGSIFKIWQLGNHGEYVAVALGGTKIPPNSTKLEERILLNVVEEMAIASGTPVPPVYLLEDELAINAFAAGTSPQNAVIGVTKGALMTLRRDELQGVIAHEFSHIMNGDMRLNLRLMGLLNGILLIALIGFILLRSMSFRSMRGSRGNDNKGAAAIMAGLLVSGIVLVVIGYAGVFFSNLIKAAVSRQREFLADASAVQFTRNPKGIADALKRIGGWKDHSLLKTAHATEASHMFFGSGVASYLFSTHPALPIRIQRIDPQFMGTFKQTSAVTHTESELIDPRSLSMARASFAGVHQAAVAGAHYHESSPQQAVLQVGEPKPEHIVHAQHIVEELDTLIIEDLHDPLGAVAVIYSLLLAPAADPVRKQQLAMIESQRDDRVFTEVLRVVDRVDALAAEQRLPVASLALPALHQMSPGQIQAFRKCVLALINADRKWTMFEFGIHRFVTKRLVKRLDPRRTDDQTLVAQTLKRHFQIVLSTLAYVGSDKSVAEKSFAVGQRAIPSLGGRMTLLPQSECSFKALDQALDALEGAKGFTKREMIAAFSSCIAADGQVEVSELELLRIIADALGCPMPPILDFEP